MITFINAFINRLVQVLKNIVALVERFLINIANLQTFLLYAMLIKKRTTSLN